MIQIPDEFSLSMLNEGGRILCEGSLWGYVNIALKKGPGNLLLFPENNILESWRFFSPPTLPKCPKRALPGQEAAPIKEGDALSRALLEAFRGMQLDPTKNLVLAFQNGKSWRIPGVIYVMLY